MKKHLLTIFFLLWAIQAQAVDFSTQVFTGYQAWFRTSCDTEFAGWEHWSAGTSPQAGAGNIRFELWPDMREFVAGDVCGTNLANLGNGSADTLYASGRAGIINKHFQWMATVGIDGVALQRFLSAATQGGAAVPNYRTWRNTTLQRVQTAAEANGRSFYVMYDLSGAAGATLVSDIQTDFAVLEGLSGNPLASANYATQGTKRVIAIYGCGFTGVNCTKTQLQSIISYFKGKNYYVVLGIPHWWNRTDVDPDQPNWHPYYFQADMILPWSVGNMSSDADVDNYFTNRVTPDKALAAASGVAYQFSMFPGFAWSNWNGGTPNMIPRRAGNLLWRQAYRVKEYGITGYIAMFDEFDEATAISKAATDSSMIPTNQYFLTLDADGTSMGSDFYLRLSGDLTRMIKGQSAHTLTIPTPYFVVTPSTPANPSATAVSSAQINVAWNASTGNVLNYRVERCQGAGCTPSVEVATVVGTTYSDTGLTSGTTYRYRIRAWWDASTTSGYSTVVGATTQAASAPSVPQNLVVAATSTTQINVSWTASTGSITNYRVERCQGTGCSSFSEISTTTSTSFSDTGLTTATLYRYRVRAFGSSLFSGYSTTEETSTQAPPPIPGGLLQASNLTYLGAFRVPAGAIGISTFEYCDPCVTTYNPTNNSLFVSGHNWHAAIAEISIPAPVLGSTLGSLNTATVLQPFVEISEGRIYNIVPLTGSIQPGGLAVVGSNLLASYYKYYDGAAEQTLSHIKSSKVLGAIGDVSGPFEIGGVPQAGFADGWMIDIPSAHQSALGGTHLIGNCCLPVIGRTSTGPSAFSTNLANLGSTIPLPATPLLYYSLTHPTLGDCNSIGTVYDCTMVIRGAVFPTGSNTVLYFGRKGMSDFCYGGGTDNPALHGQPVQGDPGVIYCYDPTDASKGGHGYPYTYKVLAYNVADLIAAKNGSRNPWDTAPYAIWDLSLPFNSPGHWLGGAAYDPATQRIFLMQREVDNGGIMPVVAVFQVTAAADTTAPVLTITGPTSSPTLASTTTPQTISGTCTDDTACTSVTWVNDRGGSGTATGTSSWSFSAAYQNGVNVLTVTGRDAANNTHTDTLTVTYTGGSIYWVSATGGTTGNCTTAQGVSDPNVYLRTITAALACIGTSAGAGAGKTVIVKAGTYTDNLDEASVGQWLPKGTAGNPFTLKAQSRAVLRAGDGTLSAGTSKAIIRRDGWLMRVCAGDTNGVNYYAVIDGFDFDFSAITSADGGLSLSCSAAGANYITMQYNDFHDATLSNLVMTGNHSDSATDGNNLEFYYNRFHDGAVTSGYPMYIQGGYRGKIIGNEFYNFPYFGLHFNDQPDGVTEIIGQHIDDWDIVGNYFHDWGAQNGGIAGPQTPPPAAIVFFNSGLLPNGSPGVGVRTYNNIFAKGDVPYRVQGNANNHTFVNNTIYNMAGDPSANSGAGGTLLLLNSTIAKNNIIHVARTPYFNGYANGSDLNFALGNITSNFCTNANNGCTVTNAGGPGFVNTSTGNYRLSAGSPAIDVGLNLGSPYNVDFTNVTRPSTGPWEIGAYEFTPATDNFARANGPLGSNWLGGYTGNSNFTIFNERVRPTATATSMLQTWSAPVGLTQSVQVTLATYGSGLNGDGAVVLRAFASPTQTYYYIAASQGAPFSTYIYRCENGSCPAVQDASVTWAQGDQLKATINDAGLISVFRNGSPVMTWTDPSPLNGFLTGIGAYTANAVTDVELDDFITIVGGAPTIVLKLSDNTVRKFGPGVVRRFGPSQ